MTEEQIEQTTTAIPGEERPAVTRVGIAGILGRTGSVVAGRIAANPDFALVGGLIRPGSNPPIDSPYRLLDDPGELLPEIDVLIDLTLPEATVALARACIRHGTPLVCGVTGLTPEGLDALELASERLPVWYARNLSHGVNVLLRTLPALAEELADYEISIVERHHRHKLDIPSGTSRALARAMRPDDAEEIPIESIREGDVTGEHTIVFRTDVEEIAVSHRSLNRGAFVAGAIRAAKRMHDAEPGWYGPESLEKVAADRRPEVL